MLSGCVAFVVVRQYFLDRTKEPPLTLKIDYLGPTNENGFVGLNSNFFVRGAKLTRADLQQTLSTTLIAHDTLRYPLNNGNNNNNTNSENKNKKTKKKQIKKKKQKTENNI